MRPTPRDESDTTIYACDSCGDNICPAEGVLGNLCPPCEKDLCIWVSEHGDTVIATTKEDAAQVMAELAGGSYEDYLDDFEKYKEPTLTIVYEDECEGDPDPGPVTKTVAEWIKENGRGLLCCEE